MLRMPEKCVFFHPCSLTRSVTEALKICETNDPKDREIDLYKTIFSEKLFVCNHNKKVSVDQYSNILVNTFRINFIGEKIYNKANQYIFLMKWNYIEEEGKIRRQNNKCLLHISLGKFHSDPRNSIKFYLEGLGNNTIPTRYSRFL